VGPPGVIEGSKLVGSAHSALLVHTKAGVVSWPLRHEYAALAPLEVKFTPQPTSQPVPEAKTSLTEQLLLLGPLLTPTNCWLLKFAGKLQLRGTHTAVALVKFPNKNTTYEHRGEKSGEKSGEESLAVEGILGRKRKRLFAFITKAP